MRGQNAISERDCARRLGRAILCATAMNPDIERNLGEQPIAQIMREQQPA
jgi:hypothetical protein